MGCEYLVRGAMMQCNCGSHPRRLNLPECHGVYVKEHPIMMERDCVAGDNVPYFGICSSSTPPDGAQEIKLESYVPEGQQGPGPDIQGKRCNPEIVGEWRNTADSVLIKGDNKAITTESYLVCKNGGLIQPVSSGQEFND